MSILGVALLVRLGFWQLDRLQERRLNNAQLIKQLSESPVSLNHFSVPADVSSLRDRTATAIGRFDFERQVILTQQNWQGAAGGHLITPFIVDNLEGAVLVDRGWIPARAYTELDLSQFDEPDLNEIGGVIRLTETLPNQRSDSDLSERREWFRVDVEAIGRQLPYQLLPFYLLQSPTKDNSELPYRVEAEIDLSDGPHLGYAIQWFIFAAMLAIGYARFVMLRGANQEG